MKGVKDNKGFWDRWAGRYDRLMSGDKDTCARIVNRIKKKLNRNMVVLELACGTVINIACGLDTRVYRLKTPPSVRWYNLDLPETIEVLRRFLKENEQISMIAKSAMDESWAAEIEDRPACALRCSNCQWDTHNATFLFERHNKNILRN